MLSLVTNPESYNSIPEPPASSGWLVIPASILALFIALVPCMGLVAQNSPVWLVLGAGLVVFPGLPLLWHVLAERRGREGAAFSSRTRFALRTLALATVIMCVSLSDLGPKRVLQNYRDLVASIFSKASPSKVATPTKPSTPGTKPGMRNSLEEFIPADATMVVGLSGSAATRELLSIYGMNTREKLAAFATCKVDVEQARVLIASRAGGPRMIVVRAPGITDERNLYCLVGVLGNKNLQIQFEGSGTSRLFLVKGFFAQPLMFKALDPTTMIATDEAWNDTVDTKLYFAGPDISNGRLATPLLRIDRLSTLWSASVAETTNGVWDLAIDARVEGNRFKLHGTSIPPTGQKDRAEVNLQVPVAFASALPEDVLTEGVRSVVTRVAAAGAALFSSNPLPPTGLEETSNKRQPEK